MKRVGVALAAVIIVIAGVWYFHRSTVEMPDFRSIDDTEKRKQAFIHFLLPYVKEAEKNICQTREQVQHAYKMVQDEQTLKKAQRRKLCGIARDYKLQLCQHDNSLTGSQLSQLLKRVNIAPPGMVLAQAALETGWGRSRFVRQGYNFFGQHCFTKGCGIAPRHPKPGIEDEVMRFSSPRESVAAYLKLLNTSGSLTEFREIRARQAESGQPLNSAELLNGMGGYSALSAREYKKRVMSVINHSDELEKHATYSCSASRSDI